MNFATRPNAATDHSVLLLYWRVLGGPERNAARVIQFAGARVEYLDLSVALSRGGEPAGGVAPGSCLVVSAAALAEAGRNGHGREWLRSITAVTPRLFVYGFEPAAEHEKIVSLFCGSGNSRVVSLASEDSTFAVSQESREVCRQFAGLVFEGANAAFDLAFEISNSPSWTTLIRIGQKPFCVLAKQDKCEIFLVACRELANLAEPVSPSTGWGTEYFSRLAPLLMFLRRALGERLWHNPEPRACFIVDDPLLQPRYGFIDYGELLRVMERERFSTSIAFIPWNYRRSDARTIEMFRAAGAHYSLCVHGCDHTAREFGATDYSQLCARAQRGLDRMRKHAQLTGLGFDDVMVFPQGVFSTVAVRALRASGYLAAVNTSPIPVDASDGTLCLEDLLGAAVTKFSGFPLFIRRYPNDPAGLVFDLFLGKPALIVEHHHYFRNGYGALASLVATLHAAEPRLAWSGLSELCSHAHLMRTTADGHTEVRFFTDRFSFRNNSGEVKNYVFSQRQNPGEFPVSVKVDGRNAECRANEDSVEISVAMAAGARVEITLQRLTPAPEIAVERLQVKVLARRVLSEFRDNCISKSLPLTNLINRLRHARRPESQAK